MLNFRDVNKMFGIYYVTLMAVLLYTVSRSVYTDTDSENQ
jgi:hypothetical protein